MLNAKGIHSGAIKTFDWTSVPRDWKLELVGNVATVRRGASPRPAGDSRYFGGAIPWFKIGDATRSPSRYLSTTEEFVNEEGAKHSVKVPAGSLIVSNSGVSLGFAVITKVDGCIHDGWLLLEKLDGVDRDYLYYCINLLTSRIRQMADGTTQPNLNTDIARRLLLPLPPKDEQLAISHLLGVLDDKIELNRRMNETLEAMARAIFKSWFVDFDPVRAKVEGQQPFGMDAATAALFPDSFQDSLLGKIPKGWTAIPLPEVVEINPSRSLGKGKETTYVDMKNMPTQGHRPTGWIRRDFVSGSRFTNGDTLVARITPCLENGKTAFVDFLQDGEVGWGSTEFIVLRPKTPLPPEYGYCLARHEDFRDFAIQNMTGSSGRQRVPTACFDQYCAAVPPEAIAHKFGQNVRPLFAKVKSNSEESATLAAIRDALLPKLICGEIRIKDAETFAAQTT